MGHAERLRSRSTHWIRRLVRPAGRGDIRRFGEFEVHVRTGEVRRSGRKLSVQDQPLAVLVALLERPGELVTRDELCGRLWPSDTFVDFEHGLNAAVKRLRDALGDSAERPTIVETLPRRGYRLIAPLDGATGARAGRVLRILAWAASAVLAAAAVAYVAYR